MSKWFASLLTSAVLLSFAPALQAQALPTATRSTNIEVGAGVLRLEPDYVDDPNYGIFVWADYAFRRYFGVEAEANFGGLEAKDDIGENTYFIGPRGTYHFRKATLFAKVMFGRGTITNQAYGFNNASSSYNAYSFGAGVDYRLYRFINGRVQYEEQKWPSFKPHTLSPSQVSVGVAYVFH